MRLREQGENAIGCYGRWPAEEPGLRFYGFSPRVVLVRRYLGARPRDVVLEIGPGSGNTARAVIGRTAGYWGVDVSAEAVRGLRNHYGDRKDVVFAVADACGDGFLGRTFDRIFSVDTLEHVDDARAFFRFAARHLVPGGTMLVCFPNGMRELKGRTSPLVSSGHDKRRKCLDGSLREHYPGALAYEEVLHGVTWFDTRAELDDLILEAGFEIEEILDIRDSAWQTFVRAVLWDSLRTLALGVLRILREVRGQRGELIRDSRAGDGERDTYEGTESFRINERGGIFRDAGAAWARLAEGAARIFPPYKAFPVLNKIGGRRILLRLRKPLKG